MANYVKVQVNTTLEDKLAELDDEMKEDKRRLVEDRAIAALVYSQPFVDTGAYITSWSIATGAGRPRGKSSHGRRKDANKEQMFNEAYGNIKSDLSKLDMSKDEFTLRNGAPHEPYVETKHKVFARLRGGK